MESDLVSIPPRSQIFVVATPIGNLEDLSPRALRILKEADVIACEDTRHTRKLLSHFAISGKELIAYADHDETAKAQALIERLKLRPQKLVLVSDAGTPAIADPGYRLIALAKEHALLVTPIPGPNAAISLASVSGLPTDRLLFIGFLPAKEQALRKELESWEDIGASIVFFDSPHRFRRTLETLAEFYPDARLCIGRELSKIHEEILNGSPAELSEVLKLRSHLKGEITAIINLSKPAGKRSSKKTPAITLEEITNDAKESFEKGESLKDLLQKYKDCGLSRSALYQLLLKARAEE